MIVTHHDAPDFFDVNTIQNRSTETDYFENWLIGQYGNEYVGNLLGSQTQGGVTMYLKAGFQVSAYRSTTYYLSQTLTVVGFVTMILGLSASSPVVGVLSLIAGVGGLFSMYQSVYQYTASANWFRYATCVSGPGYPYGMANKIRCFDGYSYSATGTCNVDEASQYTYYVPSSAVYNSYANIYSAAFAEYYKIGYQPGNF